MIKKYYNFINENKSEKNRQFLFSDLSEMDISYGYIEDIVDEYEEGLEDF